MIEKIHVKFITWCVIEILNFFLDENYIKKILLLVEYAYEIKIETKKFKFKRMFLKIFKNIYLFWIISNVILIDGAAKSKKTFIRKPSR